MAEEEKEVKVEETAEVKAEVKPEAKVEVKAEKPEEEFEERVVSINRINKTVKGGRKMRFAALVVVGDKKGHVGFGTGKAAEVPEAIKKALADAKKNVINVPIVNSTIPHDIIGVQDAGEVLLKPAPAGTGIVAGGPVRNVVELAGITDIVSKSKGSSTPINIVRATFNALKALRTVEMVAAERGLSAENIK